jgi:XTP/dITP diphosphohydrolase
VRLLIATWNQGKLREYAQLLDLPWLELMDLSGTGITHRVPETGKTYSENAILKATAYACASGLLTLADDSGLEVDALAGEPGVRSARYDDGSGSDEDRCRLLLSRLEGIPESLRSARFRCAIAIATPDSDTYTAEGSCEGCIALEAQGCRGFGYDPVFLIPDYQCTMAQLPSETKNLISHRARAATRAKEILRRLYDHS